MGFVKPSTLLLTWYWSRRRNRHRRRRWDWLSWWRCCTAIHFQIRLRKWTRHEGSVNLHCAHSSNRTTIKAKYTTGTPATSTGEHKGLVLLQNHNSGNEQITRILELLSELLVHVQVQAPGHYTKIYNQQLTLAYLVLVQVAVRRVQGQAVEERLEMPEQAQVAQWASSELGQAAP